MVTKLLISFLGVQDLPDTAQGFVQKTVFTVIFIQLFFGLSSTFYVLFVIDTVGYAQLGMLLAVSFILQAVLDFPSGVFGDWVGQKWLLFVAYLSYGLSYALLVFAASFTDLLAVYCIQAFASSQASGALQTWIDNNYKVIAGEADPQRKVYRYFLGRWQMIGEFILASAFLIGGMLSTIYFRQLVFALQSAGLVILAIAFLAIINDFPGVERQERSVRTYFQLMGGGLKAVFMNKTMFLFVIGICFEAAMWSVWGQMIIFPILFGYTGSDGAASTYRFVIWIAGIPVTGLAATQAAKLDAKWYPRTRAAFILLYFGSMLLITAWFPLSDRFEPVALILTSVVFIGFTILFKIANILEQRLFLDLIPDRNRNAVYSLIPTLVLLASAPAVIIGGELLTSLGLTVSTAVLGLTGLAGTIFFYLALRVLPKELMDQQDAEGTLMDVG
ncbi:MAG: hypothetical protein ACFFD4_19185 [Candidatus Odinarchaeota archaeon]